MSETDMESAFEERFGNVGAVKRANLLPELEHARFRDTDHSVKGAGLLTFSGLMLACDFVFLASEKDTYLFPKEGWGGIGLSAALVLSAAAFCALYSILKSDGKNGSPHSDDVVRARLFLLSAERVFRRRRRWLRCSGWLTAAGTFAYISAVLASVGGYQMLETVVRRFG